MKNKKKKIMRNLIKIEKLTQAIKRIMIERGITEVITGVIDTKMITTIDIVITTMTVIEEMIIETEEIMVEEIGTTDQIENIDN